MTFQETTQDEWDRHVSHLCFPGTTRIDYEVKVSEGRRLVRDIFAVNIGRRTISIRMLKDIHHCLFRHVFPFAGKVRANEQPTRQTDGGSEANRITSDFKFALESLSKWLSVKYDASHLNAVERAEAILHRVDGIAALHVALLQIRMFREGNNRLASSLSELQLTEISGFPTDLAANAATYNTARQTALESNNIDAMRSLMLSSSGIEAKVRSLIWEHEMDDRIASALYDYEFSRSNRSNTHAPTASPPGFNFAARDSFGPISKYSMMEQSKPR